MYELEPLLIVGVTCPAPIPSVLLGELRESECRLYDLRKALKGYLD